MLQQFVAAEIKAELGRQDQSQHRLAQALGWTDIKLSRRLRGEVPWTLDQVEQVASVLDIPRSQLLDPPLQYRRGVAS